jgi:Lon protease-like protein
VGTFDLVPEVLREVPVFPLPGTVLLPRTMISLHVFEPRYRAMMEACIEGARLLAVAMFDETGSPDEHGRPAIHPVAGIGALRRSAKLPDGRYNIVLEGLARVDISEEHPPTKTFRRATARVLEDVVDDDPAALARSIASLRALCTRALSKSEGDDDGELLEGLAHVSEPGTLADLVAAAAVQDSLDRQRVLAEPNVLERVNLVAGALGALLLTNDTPGGEPEAFGWGITPGEA